MSSGLIFLSHHANICSIMDKPMNRPRMIVGNFYQLLSEALTKQKTLPVSEPPLRCTIPVPLPTPTAHFPRDPQCSGGTRNRPPRAAVEVDDLGCDLDTISR